MKERIGDHAVVLGGSMAGVLAARALADRYRKVTVVDRDHFPSEVGMRRRGVPQDRHIHALQPSGARAIETMFPGVTQELVDQGASLGDAGRHGRWCFAGNPLRTTTTGFELLTLSRPLLEGHLRARLGRLSNVAFLDDCDVHGLILDDTATRVTGVRILRRRDGSAEEVLPAELAVDATGRGSRLPHWLEDLGYPAPDEEETGLDVTYMTCRFPRRPTDDKRIIIVSAVPPHGRRGGGAIAVEGDSWLVTLGGVLGEQAPRDIDGFVEYASTLPVDDLHDLIRDREPLGEPVLMRFPTGRRRRYDTLDRFPEGLVVAGDALCSFNPVYGQGISVAAAEAVALGECLDDGLEAIGRRFLEAISTVVGDAWSMAAAGDARYMPKVAAKQSLPERLVGRYQQRLLEAATHDPVVAHAFLGVIGMLARPPALLHPRMAARVLASSLGWRSRSPGATDAAAREPATTGAP